MKKGKLAFLIVFTGFFATLFLQNKAFFMMKQGIGINLGVAAYQAPPTFVLFIVLAFLAVGLLVGYFMALPKLIKYKREIKSLTANLQTHANKLSEIKKTMASGEPEPKPEPKPETKAASGQKAAAPSGETASDALDAS